MVCIVLAAGYATRLYPLTENFPKPLLEIKGKPIIDWLLDDIDTSGAISRYVVVSNHRFYSQFAAWAERKQLSAPVKVLDDGSISNENRLGAVKDIRFAIESLALQEDLLVIAGDNLLDFSLGSFIRYVQRKDASCVFRYDEPDPGRIRRAAAMEVDKDDLILRMEEKPEHPFSRWCCPPFYVYNRRDLPLITNAIQSGCGTDAPGSLAAWMSARTRFYAMLMPGRRYDIGNLESYQYVQEHYQGIDCSSEGGTRSTEF